MLYRSIPYGFELHTIIDWMVEDTTLRVRAFEVEGNGANCCTAFRVAASGRHIRRAVLDQMQCVNDSVDAIRFRRVNA